MQGQEKLKAIYPPEVRICLPVFGKLDPEREDHEPEAEQVHSRADEGDGVGQADPVHPDEVGERPAGPAREGAHRVDLQEAAHGLAAPVVGQPHWGGGEEEGGDHEHGEPDAAEPALPPSVGCGEGQIIDKIITIILLLNAGFRDQKCKCLPGEGQRYKLFYNTSWSMAGNFHPNFHIARTITNDDANVLSRQRKQI